MAACGPAWPACSLCPCRLQVPGSRAPQDHRDSDGRAPRRSGRGRRQTGHSGWHVEHADLSRQGGTRGSSAPPSPRRRIQHDDPLASSRAGQALNRQQMPERVAAQAKAEDVLVDAGEFVSDRGRRSDGVEAGIHGSAPTREGSKPATAKTSESCWSVSQALRG